jgi:membrane fusion protein (multidrug efflux system)
VIDAQIEALTHQVANLAGADAPAAGRLSRTAPSRAPVPAVIDRTFMLPGEYVAAGQRILMLHNPNEVWVEANIKETQVGQVKLGQTVHVTVDAYPGVKFTGKVTRIGSATTARFALLPTPNPVRQLHQDHPARAGEDRHRQSAQAVDAGHDGRSRN